VVAYVLRSNVAEFVATRVAIFMLKVVSSIVSQVATGTPLWKISVPAFIHDTKAQVDGLMIWWFSQEHSLRLLNQIASTQDPIERVALFLIAMNNPFIEHSTDKPFNSVLGEFYSLCATVDGMHYSADTEQISHHPPVSAYRIKGPSFELSSSPLFTGHIKIGFGGVDILLSEPEHYLITENGTLKMHLPNARLEPVLSKKRVMYSNGDFTVTDYSGVYFQGNIKKMHKVTGGIYQKDGTLIDSISGDLLTGLKFKSGKIFANPIPASSPLNTIVDPKAVDDPKVFCFYLAFYQCLG
jgi:hypothetical protein